MTELSLEYTDGAGDVRRVPLSGERCFIGRHSESDVCIPNGRLSRRHLQIERVGDAFIASDAGSSYGTVVNGTPLEDSAVLKDGDVLDLGGFKIRVVGKTERPRFEDSISDSPEEPETSEVAGAAGAVQAPPAVETAEPAAPQPAAAAPPAAAASASGSGKMLLWIMIPVFGIIFIFFAGVILFLALSGPTTAAKKQADPAYTDDDIYTETVNDNKKESIKEETGNSSLSNSKATGSNTNSAGDFSVTNSPPSGKPSETAKVGQNGAAFLRMIAQRDPRAFLTTEQAAKLNARIKQFSGSSALADNLKSASKSASQINSLAKQKGVRPQLLAIAAVAKLGSTRGDVYKTAESMSEVLGKLGGTIGTELADDALLVIAAYGQGAAGDTMKMRNMLQDLANKSSESARTIRTIWYLQKNSKITQAEFENALNFLAIGTISQNPKDFGVNAEPLTL